MALHKVLNELISDRMGLIGLVILISIILFSVVGSIAYSIDPDEVFFDNVFNIYVVENNNVDRIIIDIQDSNITDVDIDSQLLAIGSTSFIKILNLDNYNSLNIDIDNKYGEPIAIDLENIDSSRYILYASLSNNALMIAEITVDNNNIFIKSKRFINTPSLFKIIKSSFKDKILATVDQHNNIYLADLDARNIKKIISMEFDVSSVSICRSRIYIAGLGGYLSIIDIDGLKINTYRPVYEDLLSIDSACAKNISIATGKFGTVIVFNDGKIDTVFTGIIEDLYTVKYIEKDDRFISGGRDGILIEINPHTLSFSTVIDPKAVKSDIKLVSLKRNTESIIAVSFGEYVRALKPPSLIHPFGTTYYGRDLMAQVLEGIRMSLFVGLVIALAVESLGLVIGLISGYFGGRTDRILMSIVNFMYSIPLEPFAIMLAIIYKPSMLTVIIAITLLIWRTTARIIRSQVIQVSNTPMVEAVRALGASHVRIMFKHVVPAVMPLALLDFATVIAYAILAESTLSFLGVGAQDIYTLGNILNKARITGAWREAWWTTLIPGIFITLIVLSIYMIIRTLEKIYNPRLSSKY